MGKPDPGTLEPVRVPKSGDRSRHTPVKAYSVTTGGWLPLESTLEHDLLRELDRDRNVEWLVSQPASLSWSGKPSKRGDHVPDLLTRDLDGEVTVWDVKRSYKLGEHRAIAAITAAACAHVGWRYEVFTGFSRVRKHNLRWLHHFRHEPVWLEEYRDAILASAEPRTTLGAVIGDPDPCRRSAVWHLAWAGSLVLDLEDRLHPETVVTAVMA